jgi:hypothetical protein
LPTREETKWTVVGFTSHTYRASSTVVRSMDAPAGSVGSCGRLTEPEVSNRHRRKASGEIRGAQLDQDRLVNGPGELGLGRAYVSGELDVEGDLCAALAALRDRIPDLRAFGARQWADVLRLAGSSLVRSGLRTLRGQRPVKCSRCAGIERPAPSSQRRHAQPSRGCGVRWRRRRSGRGSRLAPGCCPTPADTEIPS